ncbi:MAG: hypothetical protein HY367_03715 [Candidatus Aenigmarchaeota archaeon]|nr:hypothetical protein [Candidatus Aenigmarchaeota archaeon]
MSEGKPAWMEKCTAVLLVAALFLVAFNTMQVGEMKAAFKSSTATTGMLSAGDTAAGQTAGVLSFEVAPKGMPPIYGAELGVSYDDVSPANPQKADETIRKLAVLDQQISLSGSDLERYIAIASQISCEYCCGAPSIIFENGQPACGCAHSYAMRGLAKYLITKHGSEYTDDQVLDEMAKWKTLFFPGKLVEKAKVLAAQGIDLSYVNLASNKYRGIEAQAAAGSSAGSSMVGGC